MCSPTCCLGMSGSRTSISGKNFSNVLTSTNWRQWSWYSLHVIPSLLNLTERLLKSANFREPDPPIRSVTFSSKAVLRGPKPEGRTYEDLTLLLLTLIAEKRTFSPCKMKDYEFFAYGNTR